MGHTRLGQLPKTQAWANVVAAFTQSTETQPRTATGSHDGVGAAQAGGQSSASASTLDDATVSAVALSTLQAARGALERAKDDPGLQHVVFLLTQLALASRSDDWERGLARHGIRISSTSSVFDLTVELQSAADAWLSRTGPRTDVAQMALRAAGDTITALATDGSHTLFGDSGDELRLALRRLSTKAGFAEVGRTFFAKFMAGFLNFYLSRITAAQLGSARLQQLGDVSSFNRALSLHCYESAAIVQEFSGQWYSKTEYLEGITQENTRGFVAFALTKLQDELGVQGSSAAPASGAPQ